MSQQGFWKDILALLILWLLATTFFWQVFSPPGYFVAGDFGGSDFTDLFIPFKKELARSFKEGKFAFWTEKIGAGFPLLGEGEVQNFYPGSLLFLFLPFIWAFNLNLFLAILGIGVSTFFLAKVLNLSQISSCFAALAFAFSGPFILNLKHLTILTTAAWLPLELALCHLYFQKQDKKILLLLPLCFALQFLSASPQITFLSIFTSGLFFVIFSFPKKSPRQKALISGKQIKSFASSLSLFCLVVALGAGLGAIQIFPSWQARSISTRAEPFIPTKTRQFALTPKALITFVVPFALANPAHPPAYETTGPLFWETTGFVGFLTVLLAIGGVFFLKRDRLFYFFFSLFLSSLLLSFGANIPLFGFFHKTFPLNLFRVPGRFLILTDLTLAMLAAKFLDSLCQKTSFFSLLPKVLGIGALIFLAADLAHFGLSYNESVPASLFEKPPKTVQFFKRRPNRGRIVSLGASFVYEKIYKTNRGWRNLGEKYLLYNEVLSANHNLFWDIPGILGYAGMRVKTSSDFENLVLSRFRVADPKKPVEFNSQSVKNLFLVGNIKYIVTPFVIEDENFVKIFEEETEYPDFKIRIYEFKEEVNRAFFVPKAEFVASEIGRQQRLIDPAFNPKEKILVEKPIRQPVTGNRQPATGSKTTIAQSSNEKVVINVEAKDDGFLVLSDTFYPGWRAFIDGREVKILRANHHFRAIPIDKGRHQVKFIYQSESLRRGVFVSLVSLMLWGTLLFFLGGKSIF